MTNGDGHHTVALGFDKILAPSHEVPSLAPGIVAAGLEPCRELLHFSTRLHGFEVFMDFRSGDVGSIEEAAALDWIGCWSHFVECAYAVKVSLNEVGGGQLSLPAAVTAVARTLPS